MSRRGFIVLIIFVFMFANVYSQNINTAFGSKTAVTGTTTANSNKNGVVYNCYKLNVRSGPWGKVLGIISVGDTVVITGKSSDNYWHKINYNGQTAFVSHKHIQVGGASASTSQTPATGTTTASNSTGKQKGHTTASSLNIRNAPWGTVLTKYSYGTDVTILGKTGDWYQIQYNGGTAYAHCHYVQPGSAPAGTVGGTGGQPTATFTSGPMNKRILDGMNSLKTKKLNYPKACGKTKNGVYYPGRLGCAYAVSLGLQAAGVKNAYSLGVTNLSTQLQRQPKPGFKKVSTSSRQPGDVIIWNPSHIGIVAGGGKAVSNSSSLGRVREHSDTYQSIRFVLRAPA
ncbi:SH3 domain-containing protein [bacterium]|nr:SH3 domain-containing protein [bacterium]